MVANNTGCREKGVTSPENLIVRARGKFYLRRWVSEQERSGSHRHWFSGQGLGRGRGGHGLRVSQEVEAGTSF